MRIGEAKGHEFLVVHPKLFRTMPCSQYPDVPLTSFPKRKLTQRIGR